MNITLIEQPGPLSLHLSSEGVIALSKFLQARIAVLGASPTAHGFERLVEDLNAAANELALQVADAVGAVC